MLFLAVKKNDNSKLFLLKYFCKDRETERDRNLFSNPTYKKKYICGSFHTKTQMAQAKICRNSHKRTRSQIVTLSM